jgi:hypothetical protein
MTGVVCFLASLRTVFIGYLVQTNFDSQWISFEAKDGLNAVGIGPCMSAAFGRRDHGRLACAPALGDATTSARKVSSPSSWSAS